MVESAHRVVFFAGEYQRVLRECSLEHWSARCSWTRSPKAPSKGQGSGATVHLRQVDSDVKEIESKQITSGIDQDSAVDRAGGWIRLDAEIAQYRHPPDLDKDAG